MDGIVEQPPKKHGGWPKGKPRKAPVTAPAFLPAPEPEAPIHVRLRLKNYNEAVEFGCAEHTVENGFHVFMYPSERDRYRTTRREFAISEIIEIEITAARTSGTWVSREPETIETYTGTPATSVAGPRIHSVRENAAKVLGEGSIKMDKMPNLTFGDSLG